MFKGHKKLFRGDWKMTSNRPPWIQIVTKIPTANCHAYNVHVSHTSQRLFSRSHFLLSRIRRTRVTHGSASILTLTLLTLTLRRQAFENSSAVIQFLHF